MHHKLIKIAEGLICEVEKQTENLECVNTQELGEVIDMIQDLSKAIYYDVVTEAMLETEELSVETVSSEESHGYASYKKYMEVKSNNSDSALLMKELEGFMQDFSKDMNKILTNALPEEKQYLHKRLTMLLNKLA